MTIQVEHLKEWDFSVVETERFNLLKSALSDEVQSSWHLHQLSFLVFTCFGLVPVNLLVGFGAGCLLIIKFHFTSHLQESTKEEQ